MPKTLLIIEPNDHLCLGLHDLFEIEGYTTHSTTDVIAGIELAKQIHPDVIISELSEPNLIGFSIMDDLQKDPKTQGIPIIFLLNKTGDILLQLKERSIKVDDYIRKPFLFDDLLISVEHYTRERFTD